MSSSTAVAGTAVLVTGANRGLGQALVDEALRRGARRVYAASRQPLTHPDGRVTPVVIDVTDPRQIEAAVWRVGPLNTLINNAGVSVANDLGERAGFDRHLAVNLFGTWAVTEAFLPSLTRSTGRIVNVVSIAALAAVPILSGYSAAKAAQLSLTQSLRAVLAGCGVKVHAVLPSCPARSTPTWPGISRFERPRRRRSPAASSTELRMVKRTFSPTPYRR